MCLYFAFGSNMLKERMLASNISPTSVAVAKLSNYRLRFAENPNWPADKQWKGAVATIEPSDGDAVWGVVWKMNEADTKKLDEQETVNKGFLRRLDSLTVTSASSEDITCFAYQLTDAIFGEKPSPHYLNVILAGAKQQNLPADYQECLAATQHNNYNGPLPLYDEIMKNVRA